MLKIYSASKITIQIPGRKNLLKTFTYKDIHDSGREASHLLTFFYSCQKVDFHEERHWV